MWIGPEDHRIVGDCLEDVRKKAGVTQAELARRLGKPQSFVSSLESGQRRVDLLEFLCIVAALKGDPDSIFRDIRRRATKVVKRAAPAKRRRG